jgi:DNA-binding GntR family transcriptional regulator
VSIEETQITVAPDDASGAVETAYRAIRSAIISGELKAGQTLQEAKLAERIGVSRTPVREALSRLGTEGLVVLERYRRGHVASFSREDVAEIFHLRANMEAHGAARAATRITAESIERLEMLESEMEAVFNDLGWHGHLAQFDLLNNQFHATIVQAAESPRLEKILASSLELPASIFNSYSEPLAERTRRTHRQHHEILASLKMRNPYWAEAAMRAHLFSLIPMANAKEPSDEED